MMTKNTKRRIFEDGNIRFRNKKTGEVKSLDPLRWDDLAFNSEWEQMEAPEHPDTAQTERDAEAGDAPSVNVIAAYVGELEATVAIEEMSSTLLPDGHEVKGLGCFIEHNGQKLLFFESGVVSDLQHDLSVAKDRIAVLEQSEQMLLKRIKKLRSKSELDDGFIDYLTLKDSDNE